jgi:hypothetical protein
MSHQTYKAKLLRDREIIHTHRCIDRQRTAREKVPGRYMYSGFRRGKARKAGRQAAGECVLQELHERTQYTEQINGLKLPSNPGDGSTVDISLQHDSFGVFYSANLRISVTSRCDYHHDNTLLSRYLPYHHTSARVEIDNSQHLVVS